MDAAAKHGLLELIDRAVADGWERRRACRYVELDERRAHRWDRRRAAGSLADRPAGGHPVHGLLQTERAAIVSLFDRWGEVDRSHRKLAHRGSREKLVWVSPSTVMRVLAAEGLILRAPRRAGRSERRPFPDWASYTKNSIWIYDATHFRGCPRIGVVAVMDLVTRKWICEIVSPEETSTQVQVAFLDALEAEDLMDHALARADEIAAAAASFDAEFVAPLLLAVSDNGPQMTAGTTREFMAMAAIAQHFGRPGTPTDQAWIESLFSHLKADWPHLDRITDPVVLRTELARVRHEYNTIRLHAGIGYVTPDDEHEGRGEAIRRARRAGLHRARRARIAYHRKRREQRQPPPPPDAD